MKLFTIVAICDGLQICGVGLLRSVGAQKYGLIIAFIGFYVVAASIGYPLLFKTNLHIFGNYSDFEKQIT
jgi:Na+-driven multidrug efflux pump